MPVPVEPTPILVEGDGRTPGIVTPRDDTVETLHGNSVSDPYRWLEGDSHRVEDWVRSQNELTRRTLGAVPGASSVRARLEELSTNGDVSRPVVKRMRSGTFRYFYGYRTGRQDQPQLLARDGNSETPRIVLDPNSWNASGSVALDWYFPSEDGRLVAYGRSDAGDEWSTLLVRDVETGRDLSDVIERTRHASLCWKPDSSGFYYTRYPAPGTVPKGEEGYHRRLYEHRLGTQSTEDRLVFGDGLEMTDTVACALTPDGRYLVVTIWKGWNHSIVHVADTRSAPLRFERVTEGKEHVYIPIVEDDTVFLLTNDAASRYRLLAFSPKAPHETLRSVIDEHPRDVLDEISSVGGELIAVYLEDGASRLERFDRGGKSLGNVPLPGLGTIGRVSGHERGREAFFEFESFVDPKVVYRLDLATAKTTVWASLPSVVNASGYVTTRGHAVSRDGTRVPFFSVRASGANLGDPAPTLLYGYGGFNVNITPRFSAMAFALLERGVCLVQAALRGGGEYGEAWHRAGQLENKQNVFDDFIAVAEHLVETKVTSRERLAISGRSNGGLLVAAAITQRPELFRAAVAGVPLSDMLRYDRFLIGKLWVPEYGSPADPKHFQWLSAYSPYHRVRADVGYPAVLVTTGEHDGRVHPMHARKFAAALQHASASGRPVLLRSEDEAGHGAGKPRHLVVDEQADTYTFVLWQLGLLEN